MKNLLIKDILSILEGKIIKGKETQLIENVASYNEHKITDHTLVFIKRNKQAIPLPQHVKSITVVTSQPSKLEGIREDTTVIQVPNVRKSYMKFIHYYRNLFQLPVIGVTGTCGKTTTKEMISWILSEKQKIVSTVLSRNGLRRNLDYLISIDETTDSAVFEMGVSGPNQLLYSAQYFQPQIGIITTIGTDHIEGFKSQEVYVREKSNMLKAVRNGTIILNSDDKGCQEIDLKSFHGTVIKFGKDQHADFKAHSISFNHVKQGMDFVLIHKKSEYACFVPGYGTHNVYNALAALAAVNLVGVHIQDAVKRLETFKHIKSHLQFHEGIRGSRIIDDTWNTNPSSIAAALEVLRETSKDRKKVAIIGEIEELGKYSISEHEKIGEIVVQNKVDVLITVGKQTVPMCRKAAELGMNPSAIFNLKDKHALLKVLNKVIDTNTTVLVKTSMRKSFKDVLDKLIRKNS